MGNSEVGHLNIGAGRTVYQSLTRISKSIQDGDFFTNAVLSAAMNNAKGGWGAASPIDCPPSKQAEIGSADRTQQRGRSLHVMGLVSPGGVHSHTEHLRALVEMAKQHGVQGVYIHAFLDGRDAPPRSAEGYLRQLEQELAQIGAGVLVSITGRYYAMDRDNRWERVEQAYDALTAGTGIHAVSGAEAILAAYERGENDEFVKPTNIFPSGGAPIVVRDGDSVVFFNFRPDRARELTRAFTEPDFKYETKERAGAEDESVSGAPRDTYIAGFDRKVFLRDLYFATMTEYDASLKHTHTAYPPEEIKNTLGEYLSACGLKQLRVAETEKYAHVTFFFNGGVEAPNPGEDRVLIASPQVATYDLKPEMSAFAVAERAAEEIRSGKYDAVILNFANMDMVGHTGVLEAAKKAVEAVDACVGIVMNAITAVGGQFLLTADHGNSENMLTEDGAPVTAHTTNPVRLVLFRSDDRDFALEEGGALSDLAPTLLDMMGLPKPPEMTGHSLLKRK
jgi:2,3-bisphosphoglycerate-independent phosphoglycerate mutase